ncbi:MAG: YHS domain-containing (seleno)protein [Pseudomonadota bacterium]
MRRFLTILIAGFMMAGAPSLAMAAKPEVYTPWRNDLAVSGYDVVSFHAGEPQRGRSEFSVRYKDAIWRFDTRANLELFRMNPDAFAPQYGGYCAWAVAMGKLAPGSPDHWHVENGKLYLNYSTRVKKRWDALRKEFIRDANGNWPDILDE